ncbi:MAG: T9SS type A sorting domain-containing protein [Bacteroidetes bacterium]|nr:T9SS type A sorting domain-containing protein [Bacteroidota bacterium]
MRSFKKSLKITMLLFAWTIFVAGNTYADEIKYTDSWEKQGYTLTNQKSSEVEITYSINSFTLTSSLINGETMDVIELSGHFLPNDEGAPNLPGMGRFIAIPQGAIASIQVTSSRTETFTGIDMSPAPRIPWETEDGPLEYKKDQNIYSKNEFYPSEPVKLSEVTNIRGVDVVVVGITPFQYNPITKELIVYRDLKVKVNFTEGNGHFGENRLRNRWWDPLMADMMLNYESLPKMDYNKSFQGQTKDTGCEYLIITPNGAEFQQWADTIRKFRTLQGILTEVYILDEVGGNNTGTIENFINNAYNNWDIAPAACLLLGDYGTDAAKNIISPIYNSYCASDNIYADVSGNHMPDIVFARITANNEGQLETMVTKFLDNERTPPTNPDFYDHPITALGWQTERWFQICTEVVGGFWREVQGKDPVRINAIYSGSQSVWSTATNTSTILNYFGPNGLGYIPASPSTLGGWSGGNATMVKNAINSGAFMLQHRDHGWEFGWGEPYYQNSDINNLTNNDLVFVWSINCLTGKFNIGSECFAEKFHRHTSGGNNAGALGIVAASETSYSFVNDTYVWGAYDNMWPDFMPGYGTTPDSRGILPAFGNSAGKYFLQQSSWPYNTGNKQVTYYLFHHHGDAFLTVYSEVPQNLTVTHEPVFFAGLTSFDITADAGSLIALTVNEEIIGTAEGTGSQISITIPPQQPLDMILITVTKQNYYRYEAYVEVIPPTGPYLVQQSFEIDDEGTLNNGLMNPGESITCSVTYENIGIQQAENLVVTFVTTDPYITLTDDTEDNLTIPSGSSLTIENGFAWDVHDDIPDLHLVTFDVIATDGNDTWASVISIEAYAPVLAIGSFTIDDATGNGNGKLDPGETADIIFETYNNGSSHALQPIGTLFPTSEYVVMNNSTYNFNVISAGTMEQAVFNVSVDNSAPNGTFFLFDYEVISGGYEVDSIIPQTIGFVSEDWETGTMTQFDWETGGNADWFISQQNPYEGTHCVQSGDINDNQSTWLSLNYDVANDDIISFFYKVSSQDNYDMLKFYIDNQLKDTWTGTIDWTHTSYSVTAGSHTFKWTYSKNSSTSTGSDCGWIDNIQLPSVASTTAFAGFDAIICESDDFQCEGLVYLADNYEWTTSGTGTFDDNAILTPVYIPGADDIANGSVVLTLTAFGSEQTVSDDMTLTINQIAIAYAGEDATFCSNSTYEISDATAENYASVEWTTSGDGTFDDISLINPVYTPGSMDINNGSATLTFTVTAFEPCNDAIDELMLTFELAPVAYAGEDNQINNDETYIIGDATAENYFSVLWETSGDGTFDDASSVNPTYTPGPNDIEAEEVTLTITVNGNDPCGAVTDDMLLTIHTVGVIENAANLNISIFPNPNTGSFIIEMSSENNELINISIFNSLSKVVYEQENIRINGIFSETIDLDVEQGVYYMKIEGKDILINKKVIIQK